MSWLYKQVAINAFYKHVLINESKKCGGGRIMRLFGPFFYTPHAVKQFLLEQEAAAQNKLTRLR